MPTKAEEDSPSTQGPVVHVGDQNLVPGHWPVFAIAAILGMSQANGR